MDRETQNIIDKQKLLSELLNHGGWSIARNILTEKILELQNAFNIDSATPTIMLRDLQARKKATEILFDFLREIEGSKEVMEENKEVTKSHIINLE